MTGIFTIEAHGYGPVLKAGSIPVSLEGYHVPGSLIFSADKPFGKLLFQVIDLEGFIWAYSIFDIEADITFLVYFPKPLSVCHIDLSGNAEHDSRGLAKIKTKQSQYNIFFFPYLQCNSYFRKGHRYISIYLLYPVDYMVQTLAYFPSFEKFEQDIRRELPSLIPYKEIFLNAKMSDLVYQLIHSPYSPNVKNFHLNLLTRILYGLLKKASVEYDKPNKFFLHRVENIYQAKAFIDAHLYEHFSISLIAKKAGLNEHELKKGFKEIFGKGLFEYLLSERLNIARMQLEQTYKPINEIARKAGYKTAGNFSVSFKKKFQKTPNHWRKDYKRDNK